MAVITPKIVICIAEFPSRSSVCHMAVITQCGAMAVITPKIIICVVDFPSRSSVSDMAATLSRNLFTRCSAILHIW